MFSYNYTIGDLRGIERKLKVDGAYSVPEYEAILAHAIEATFHRELLIESIAELANKIGITSDEAVIDGPLALMLLGDIEESYDRLESSNDNAVLNR